MRLACVRRSLGGVGAPGFLLTRPPPFPADDGCTRAVKGNVGADFAIWRTH